MGWRQVHLPGGGTGPGGPGISDAFILRFAFPDANSTPTDALAVALVFPETVPGQGDSISIRFLIPDTVPVTNDTLASLRIAIADSIPSLVDAVSLRLVIAESNAAPSDGLAVALRGLGDVNAVPADALARLAVSFNDTAASQTDSFLATVRTTLGDSNAAPADVARLAMTSADSIPAQADGRDPFTIRSGFTAFTVVQGQVIEPAKMVPYPDHDDPPAAANGAWMGYLAQGALQAQPILDLHTPNVPAAGYVVGSAQLWVSWYTPSVADPMWWEFIKHDGSIVEVLVNPNDATHFGKSPQFWRRGDDPAGTAAQVALRAYLNTATVAQLNACKSRFRTAASSGTQLNVLYVDAAVFVTRHT